MLLPCSILLKHCSLNFTFFSSYFNHKMCSFSFRTVEATCVWTANRLVIWVTDPSSCCRRLKIKEGRRRREEVDCLISGGMSELVELLLTHVQNVAPTFCWSRREKVMIRTHPPCLSISLISSLIGFFHFLFFFFCLELAELLITSCDDWWR